jgi:hypothetical protein
VQVWCESGQLSLVLSSLLMVSSHLPSLHLSGCHHAPFSLSLSCVETEYGPVLERTLLNAIRNCPTLMCVGVVFVSPNMEALQAAAAEVGKTEFKLKT